MRKETIIATLLLLLSLSTPSCAQIKGYFADKDDELNDTSGSERKGNSSDTIAKITRIDSLVNYAYTFLGDRYRRGGTGGKGFDCSGFTMTVFRKFGIKLPHTSAGQGLMGVEIRRDQIRKGDLIFFRGRGRRGKRIGHVGIVISEKGEAVRFIHSSTSEGVRIDRLDFEYYKKRFIKVMRIAELYK